MNISIKKNDLIDELRHRIKINRAVLLMEKNDGFGGSLPNVELNLLIDNLVLAALTDVHAFIEMVGEEE